MTTLKVELLKGQDNYQLWFIRMKGVLQGQSLWTYLTGDRKEPSKKENEDDEDFSDRMDKYWQNCHKARGLIIQTVSNEILLNLEHIESAKECWDYLQEQYKPTGMAFAHAKFLEWDTLCFDGKDIQHYCNAYKATCSNLKEAQEELSNSLKLHRFIHQISPYYNAFCTGLRQDMRKIVDKKDLPTLDNVISMLLDEHLAQTNIESANIARGAGGRNNFNKPQGGDNSSNTERCSHCGIKGHGPDVCFHLRPDLRPSGFKTRYGCIKSDWKLSDEDKNRPLFNRKSGSNNKETSSTAESFIISERQFNASTVDEHVTEKTAQLLQTTHDSEVWYVDSGATSHFTNNLAGMHNISVVDLPVGFGQGSSRATALGSVKLTLKGNLNVTFSNVLYVPGIKANLLSTEKLKAKGLFVRPC